MISRQPKIHIGLRIVAAGCIVLWLQAASHCAIEQLFGDDHHHSAQAAEAGEYAHSGASHAQDSEQSSHDSHPHDDGDNCCCSTVIATAQIATPFIIIKPVLEPLDVLCTVLQTRDSMFAAPGEKAERQAKDRDRVFKPEVCLDPAHRSLAPPSLA